MQQTGEAECKRYFERLYATDDIKTKDDGVLPFTTLHSDRGGQIFKKVKHPQK